MQITRKSAFTGKVHTLDINITQAQLDQYYKGGALLQRAFPNLTNGDREFIKSGVTQAEWDVVFPPDEEEEER